MERMFYNCSSLASLDISNFNFENVKNMEQMLYGCNSLKFIDISSFVVNKNIFLFSQLPNNCSVRINKKSDGKIKTIPNSCDIFLIDL